MEQFLTPKLKEELCDITMEYIYCCAKTFITCPGFIKRNMISKETKEHEKILANWMSKDAIPSDYDAWEHLKLSNVVPACICMTKLGDMLVHVSTKEEAPFNIFYCPENMQEFQKFRMRLWWEYFSLTEKIYEINTLFHNKEICYTYQEVREFLEMEQITNDAYIRTLACKFYPNEYK